MHNNLQLNFERRGTSLGMRSSVIVFLPHHDIIPIKGVVGGVNTLRPDQVNKPTIKQVSCIV